MLIDSGIFWNQNNIIKLKYAISLSIVNYYNVHIFHFFLAIYL